MLQPGDLIGPLRVERALGAGGMGEVWLARDERLERLVAVKLLPAESRLDPAARGRMLREARAASGLKHPGIVTVHDIGDHEGRAYIVLEYVEGETFDALVERRGPLPPDEAVELVAQVGDAVDAAHAAGILHRDLKAQNLMLDGAGRVKVLDFGLSKRTDTTSLSGDGGPTSSADVDADDSAAMAATVMPDAATTPASGEISQGVSTGRTDEPRTAYGVRMGTPGWAPPELMNGGLSDVRSDVFALGVVLYHLLTGAMPFPAKTWGELRDQMAHGPAPPSSHVTAIPRALDDIVLSAVAARADRRPSSVRAFIDAARAALAPRRSRARLFVGAGAAAAVGVAALVIAGSGKHPSSARTPALVTNAVDAASDATLLPAEPRRLTSLGGCAYLPAFIDEDTLSFDLTRDGTVDLYTLDLGGEPVRRTDAPGWEWRSSRGESDQSVLFLEELEDSSYASRYDLATRTATRLFPTAGPVALVGDAYFHAPDPGNVLRRRKDNRDEPFLHLEGAAIDSIVPSPDGSMLALITFGNNQLAQLCITPTARAELKCFEALTGSSRPAWSSRGDAVYLDGKLAIHEMSLASAQVTTAVPDVVATGGIAVSRSGARLVFSDCITRGKVVEITAKDRLKPIVDEEEAQSPAFGPGGRLAYVGIARNVWRVMVRDPDGTLREVARHSDARVTGLTFSADGEQLAYVVGSRTEPGIYAVRLDSSAVPNRLTDVGDDSDPLFSGDAIFFTRAGTGGVPRLMRMSLDGSDIVEASHRPRRTIAADGVRKRLLLASPAQDFLYWWDPATGVETPGPVLPRPMAGVRISPSGSWLMSLEGAGGQRIHRMRLDARPTVETLPALPGDLTANTGSIDDDGHILITLFRWAGELWLVEPPAGARW